MTPLERLFDATSAFDYQITVTVLLVIGAMLVVAPIAALSLGSAGLISESTRSDILIRTRSWLVIALIVLIPILLGAFWAMALVLLISLLGYTEFARITGLFRERLVSLTVLVGILLVNLTVLDNWYGLFVALAPLGVVTIAIVGILSDRPSGYIQRIALGSLGFLLFGVCLGHLAFIGNSEIYRALMIVLILTVALNDIFAYITGKALGRRKLCPNTSPNKTIAGALGAIVLTTATVVVAGLTYFQLPQTLTWLHLVVGGVILSLCGQLGDLMLSSIKRDIGIKDTGSLIPGHGGLLDRIDSLILTSPAAFHFLGYFGGLRPDEHIRILTG